MMSKKSKASALVVWTLRRAQLTLRDAGAKSSVSPKVLQHVMLGLPFSAKTGRLLVAAFPELQPLLDLPPSSTALVHPTAEGDSAYKQLKRAGEVRWGGRYSPRLVPVRHARAGKLLPTQVPPPPPLTGAQAQPVVQLPRNSRYTIDNVPRDAKLLAGLRVTHRFYMYYGAYARVYGGSPSIEDRDIFRQQSADAQSEQLLRLFGLMDLKKAHASVSAGEHVQAGDLFAAGALATHLVYHDTYASKWLELLEHVASGRLPLDRLLAALRGGAKK